MSAEIMAALWSRLASLNSPGQFHALLGGRIYQDAAPGDTALPLCVYAATNTRLERGFNNSRTESVTVIFTLYGTQETNDNLVTAITALRTGLDGVNLSPTNYDRARALLKVRGIPEFEDEIWSISDTYELTGQLK